MYLKEKDIILHTWAAFEKVYKKKFFLLMISVASYSVTFTGQLVQLQCHYQRTVSTVWTLQLVFGLVDSH
ncbi:hypothetical protein DD598_25230 [Enterobacter cloacae complex sp. 2DZ2F16B1]|nr:hypothetical protein DD598_25230 [Enterobacter cloacae complex sp. 2DZ2F16B1]